MKTGMLSLMQIQNGKTVNHNPLGRMLDNNDQHFCFKLSLLRNRFVNQYS